MNLSAFKQQRVLLILAIIIFGAIGAYLTFYSKAATSSYVIQGFAIENPQSHPAVTAGTEIIRTAQVNGPFVSLKDEPFIQVNEQWQYLVVVSSHRNYVQYVDASCNAPLQCTKLTKLERIPPNDPQRINTVLCMNMPTGSVRNNSGITGTIQMKFKAAKTLPDPYEYIRLMTLYAPGSCSSNTNGAGYTFVSGATTCNNASYGNSCDTGSDIDIGPAQAQGRAPGSESGVTGAASQDGTGQGNTSTTQSNSSSAGGTMANRSGDAPNAIADTTAQGVQQDAPMQNDPSPFFDGRQYGLGSDFGSMSADSSSAAPKSRVYWIVGAALVLILGIAGGVYGYQKQKNRKK